MTDESGAAEAMPFPSDRLGDLNALLETSAVLNASRDLEDVLRTILQIATRVVKAEASSLVLVEKVGDALVCQVALGSKGRIVEQQLRLPVGKGIVGWVVEHGQPVCVNDVQNDQRFYGGLDEMTGFRTVSILCVPMIAHQRTVGAIEVLNARHADGFQPADQALLTALATQAAIAIDNARLRERLSQENQALRSALHAGADLVGEGPAMTLVKEWIARIAPSDASVLIRGASGTGKNWSRERFTIRVPELTIRSSA